MKLVDVWKSDDTSIRRQLPWLALYALGAAAAFHTHTTFAILPVLANVAMAVVFFWRTPRALAQAVALPAGHTIHATIAIGPQGDPATLPEALQARETPNGREPLDKIAHRGSFAE